MRQNAGYGRGPECPAEHEVRADAYRHQLRWWKNEQHVISMPVRSHRPKHQLRRLGRRGHYHVHAQLGGEWVEQEH